MSHNVQALRQAGIDARGIAMSAGATQSGSGLRLVDTRDLRRWTWRWLKTRASMILSTFTLILWADVVHWYSGIPFLPAALDLRLIERLSKPGVNLWTGSEIRIPEVESADNPYYEIALKRGYEYAESWSGSERYQRRMADAGFVPIVVPGMEQYVCRSISPRAFSTMHGVPVSDYEPCFPDPCRTRPLIVHAPTAPAAKGTDYVLRAIEELKGRCAFDFVLIQDMRREDALREMSRADIVLDQFILGDYGMAAVEGMALGKPVLCYVKPSVRARYPSELPIADANPDNLASRLYLLLVDGDLRRRLGEEGRAYVEKYHDSRVVAQQLLSMYEAVLEDRRS